MSGPIVRKYGFPNHEQIFGRRPLEHGVEETEPKADPSRDDAGTPAPTKPKSAGASKSKPKPKS